MPIDGIKYYMVAYIFCSKGGSSALSTPNRQKITLVMNSYVLLIWKILYNAVGSFRLCR